MATNPFYKSTKWKRKREKILRRDGYMCQVSKRYGKRIRLGFTWDADTPSVKLYTDWEGSEGGSISVTGYCIDVDDPILKELLETIEYLPKTWDN